MSIAVIFLLATSLLTLQMFVYALFGIKYSLLPILLPWLAFLPAIKLIKLPKMKLKEFNQLELLLFALISIKVIYVFCEALIKPVVAYDAIWNFSLRAKIFFLEKSIPLVKGAPYFLGDGMRQYPPHLPLLETFSFLALNSWDDVKMKVIFPLYFIALLVIFYKSVRREKGRTQSLFFTLLLSTLPMLTYHATIEYADFIAGAYFLAAASFLCKYFEEKKLNDLIISSLLIGAAGWVKDEGIVFYAVCALVLIIHNRLKDWKPVAVYLIPSLIFTLPWLITKKALGLTFGNDPNFSFAKPAEYISFHPEVFDKLFQKTFLTDNWHLLPLAFIVFLVFYYRQIISTNKKYLLMLFAGAWLFFMYVYVFTGNAGMITSDIILSRNYLTYFPLALYLMAITFDRKDAP